MEMCEKSATRKRQGGRGQGLYPRKFVSELLKENALRACSACAGDYEDPERTAWRPGDAIDDDEGDDNRATETMEEESPADK